MNQLRLLEYAVALDHHRNFARAAQAMHVTQPSFSRAIAALESRLGVRLFERNNREVRPTAAGQILLQRARRLLADHAAIGDALDAQRTLRSGSLSVAAGPYALEISVTEAVARLSRRHPQLQIELIEGDWRRLGPLMLAGNIDLGVFDLRIVENDHRFLVDSLPAHPGRFFVRQGHPLAGGHGLRLQQVLDYPLVGMRGFYRMLAEAAGPAAGLQIDASTGEIVPRLATTSAATTRTIVQRTDGVGIAVLAQLEDDIRLGRLVTLDVDWPGVKSSYGIVRLRERAPSAAAVALAECIREVEAERAVQEAAPRPAPRTTALA
jgi:DNA-binding transcriptional LysR family regulator